MIGISNKTIYAVSALQELATISDNELLKIKDIASNASIPRNFLEQILLSLKKQGFLTSIKGANGGYKLAKSLKDITLKDVVITLESDIFSSIYNPQNQSLNLFWADFNNRANELFDIPLSELQNYQNQANKTLNYSI
ncbi:MAG: Rrf2 family transcriptional regulator [Sulfurovum sp.]